MTFPFPPALLFFIAAPLAAFLPDAPRRALLVGVPLAALILVAALPYDAPLLIPFGAHVLVPFLNDPLSFPFALAFAGVAALGALFSSRVSSKTEHVCSLLYIGSAIGAVFARDVVSFFIFWEGTAVASFFLILSAGPHAAKPAFRYLLHQILSGSLLFAAVALLLAQNKPAFDVLDPNSLPGALALIAFGVKAAFPLLHTWLKDAYPAASPAGSVILSAFSTKLAVYALARCFPGYEPLIFIGVAMTLFPVLFAAIENNLRRVLSYSLNNQVGFMVAAIGVGTPLAVNGAVAHAFVHIFYKALLFMSLAAAAYRVGSDKASNLGGLAKYMPISAACCIIGAASIAAAPLFSGFVAKSISLDAVLLNGFTIPYILLVVASIGVMEHSGIKIPYFTFFAPPHLPRTPVREAPVHMLIPMLAAAALCIGFGVFPHALHSLLPYPIPHTPYSASHTISQTQLLLFAGLAFVLIVRLRLYPKEIHAANLDADWALRVPLKRLASFLAGAVNSINNLNFRPLAPLAQRPLARLRRLTASSSAGAAALWICLLFLAILLSFLLLPTPQIL